METSGYNYMTSKWFNNRLFSLNEVPLKFYLEGYGQTEFHEIVRIIEAYGGELSSPDAPDTFVFCETNDSVGVENYDRYDIQYFQDSIIALHSQDLMKYKLRRSQNLESLSSENEVRSQHSKTEGNPDECPKSVKYKLHEIAVQPSTSYKEKNYESINSNNNEIHPEQKNNSDDDYCIDSCFSDTETMQIRRNSRATTEARVCVDRLEDSQMAGPSTSLRINHQKSTNDDGDSDSSYQSSSEEDGNSHDLIVSQTIDDRSSQSKSNKNDIPVDHSLSVSTSIVKKKRGKGEWRGGRKMMPFTVEENETIMRWLMEKNFIPSNTGASIWKRFLEEKVLPRLDVSAQTLSNHFRRELKGHPTFVNWIRDMETSGRKFDHALKKGRKSPAFTEEENQTIIRWLMEKNVMPSNGGKSIWSRFLKEKVLPHRNITLGKLQGHFNRELNEHPTFVQWIEDMKTSGRKFNSSSSKKPPRYSEEENRIMIHHIIHHDAYRRVVGENVWQELLLSSKISLHSERTALGLVNHFRQFLSKNYAQYTDDPGALKKFNEIELRRKRRTQNSGKRIDLG